MKGLLHLMAIVALGLFCQGCFTAGTWYNAETDYSFVSATGYARRSAAPDSKGLDYIALNYSCSSKWPLPDRTKRFAIPCKGGLVPEPFAYQGLSRRSNEIIDSVSNAQIQAMRTSLSNESASAGRGLKEAKGYTRVTAFVCGPPQYDFKKDIQIRPYNCAGMAAPNETYGPWSPVGLDYELDSGWDVLIAPRSLPRSKLDVFANRSLAVLETPFAVAADLVTLPFQFFFYAVLTQR